MCECSVFSFTTHNYLFDDILYIFILLCSTKLKKKKARKKAHKNLNFKKYFTLQSKKIRF